jgi:4,5-DOPA dioxygenase extradiol
MGRPRTIHDFGGFPEELYNVSYPAPGSPELAGRVQELLASVGVESDDRWGLDHGTWSVLCHVFPRADVPVVQLSIDGTKPPSFHYEMGRMLAPLRDEGVLVIGSGNTVHNLQAYAWGQHDVTAFDWATRFEEHVRGCLIKGEDGPLIDYQSFGRDATLSVPTPDHYLPLLYVLALKREGDDLAFPVGGLDGGSVSMLTVQIG